MRPLNTDKLTKQERQVLIRFCFETGAKLECRTTSLHRPFTMEDLESAFLEYEDRGKQDVQNAEKLLEDYKKGKSLPAHVAQFLGTEKPSLEDFERYIKAQINQLSDFNIRKSFGLSVNYEYFTDKILAFHKSLNPRASFGYSNQLHEACSANITDDMRRTFSKCLKDFSSGLDFSYGNLQALGEINYEDLQVMRDDGSTILETISHEFMFDIFLSDEELVKLKVFDDKQERNEKIIKKLLSEKEEPEIPEGSIEFNWETMKSIMDGELIGDQTMTDEEIKAIIDDEILVDVYSSSEEQSAWQCYLEDNISGFPFKAKHANYLHETVEVKAIDGVFCGKSPQVAVQIGKKTITVPLETLTPIDADDATRKAMEVWRFFANGFYDGTSGGDDEDEEE